MPLSIGDRVFINESQEFATIEMLGSETVFGVQYSEYSNHAGIWWYTAQDFLLI